MKIEKLTSKLFEDIGVNHGFIKRGDNLSVKTSPLTNTNMSDSTRNLQSIIEQEFPDSKVSFLYLVGGADVAKVEGSDGSMTILDVDGAATREPMVLAQSIADCMPILLFDKKNNVAGIAHGGWKNMAGDIVTKTVAAMEELGAETENMVAAIGPSICVECFEVGEEVAEQFDENVVDRSFEKPHVDLWQEAETKLRGLGIKKIDNLKVCTFENTDSFFSARKEKMTGRYLAYLEL